MARCGKRLATIGNTFETVTDLIALLAGTVALMRTLPSYAFVLSLLLLGCQQVLAEDMGDRWKHFYEGIAKSYSIAIVGEKTKTLALSSYPALVWSNPARTGDTHGAFWVWTRDGRPEAVGTIFSYRGGRNSRVVAHEFHSLSQSSLVAKLNDQVVWTPAPLGIQWKELPGAPVPATTRPRRFLQMRAIAREFVVTAQNEVEQAEGEQPMRLLTQPLYRYETPENGADGALFTFVLGTDPECLLLIESDPIAEKWRMAAARFTHLSFEVQHKGATLFQHTAGTEPEGDPNFRYVCFRNGTAPREPPATANE